MYRIIGQPINLRYIATSNIVKAELSEKALQITKIAEFGLRYGYTAALEAFELKKSRYYNYVKQYKLCKEHDVQLEVSQSVHTMCVRQSGIIRS